MIALWIGIGVFVLMGTKVALAKDKLPVNTSSDFFKYDPLFKKYGAKAGVPWWVLKVFSRVESNIGRDPRVRKGEVSSDGLSWGLMQIAPSRLNVKNLGYYGAVTPAELNKPEVSVDISSRLVAELWKVYKGELQWVVKAYNQGQGNTDKEKKGLIKGYTGDYWAKWQRYRTELEKEQGEKYV